MEQMAILDGMLKEAKKHNLEMECLISMLNLLLDSVTDDELQTACNGALYEWDI